MSNIQKILNILKVQIQIWDTEFQKIETIFFLKLIVANIFPETTFSFKMIRSIGSLNEICPNFRPKRAPLPHTSVVTYGHPNTKFC